MGGGTPKWHAFYGQGSGPVYVGSMSCNGREEKLSECSGLVWDAKGCQHKEDAGVICRMINFAKLTFHSILLLYEISLLCSVN